MVQVMQELWYALESDSNAFLNRRWMAGIVYLFVGQPNMFGQVLVVGFYEEQMCLP